jgi:thiol-disulfide isomerase/thioredoxin
MPHRRPSARLSPRVASALLAALTLVVFSACGSAPSAPAGRLVAATERTAAPGVRGDLLGGGSFDMGQHRGDVVVVNFWASWCSPCWAEADDLERVYQSTKGRGVTFIGVNTRDETDAATGFVRDLKVTYPSIVDRPGKVALNFDVPPTVLPATVLIDRQGRLAMVIPGAVLSDTLGPVVTQLVAESP